MHYFKGIKVVFLLAMIAQRCVFAQSVHPDCDSTLEKPCLVQDSKTPFFPIELLRDASMILDTYQGNTIGIKGLLISGSEEPSESGWRDIARYIASHKPKNIKSIVVLDLRQESHGYLNGRSITLVSNHNWLNLGKTNEQINQEQENWLKNLSEKKKAKGVLTPLQYDSKEYSNGKSVPINAIRNEQYYAAKWGFEYHRIYIADHRAPLDSEVDAFLTLVKSQPKKTWFHVHCRAGKGRTTSILAMYDMLKNADKVSFNEIIARQASIPPYYNLMDIYRTYPELTPYYAERLVFLAQFYEFSRQSLLGYNGTWTEWKMLNT